MNTAFFLESPVSTDAAPEPKKNAAPPAWKPGGVAKRPPLPTPEPSWKQNPSPVSDGCMPLQEARRPQELVPGNIEARVREREESRQAGGNLFGRQGVLREIAQLQMPMPAPESKVVGAPNYGEQRAAERRAAKEARVQAILEEREEHERLNSENLNLRKIRLTSGAVSMPVLPAAGASSLSLGPVGKSLPLAPEEMERQKLRVACKIETLAFLNGYHNAMGKMTMEQKASLLAQLHQSKS